MDGDGDHDLEDLVCLLLFLICVPFLYDLVPDKAPERARRIDVLLSTGRFKTVPLPSNGFGSIRDLKAVLAEAPQPVEPQPGTGYTIRWLGSGAGPANLTNEDVAGLTDGERLLVHVQAPEQIDVLLSTGRFKTVPRPPNGFGSIGDLKTALATGLFPHEPRHAAEYSIRRQIGGAELGDGDMNTLVNGTRLLVHVQIIIVLSTNEKKAVPLPTSGFGSIQELKAALAAGPYPCEPRSPGEYTIRQRKHPAAHGNELTEGDVRALRGNTFLFVEVENIPVRRIAVLLSTKKWKTVTLPPSGFPNMQQLKAALCEAPDPCELLSQSEYTLVREGSPVDLTHVDLDTLAQGDRLLVYKPVPVPDPVRQIDVRLSTGTWKTVTLPPSGFPNIRQLKGALCEAPDPREPLQPGEYTVRRKGSSVDLTDVDLDTLVHGARLHVHIQAPAQIVVLLSTKQKKTVPLPVGSIRSLKDALTAGPNPREPLWREDYTIRQHFAHVDLGDADMASLADGAHLFVRVTPRQSGHCRAVIISSNDPGNALHLWKASLAAWCSAIDWTNRAGCPPAAVPMILQELGFPREKIHRVGGMFPGSAWEYPTRGEVLDAIKQAAQAAQDEGDKCLTCIVDAHGCINEKNGEDGFAVQKSASDKVTDFGTYTSTAPGHVEMRDVYTATEAFDGPKVFFVQKCRNWGKPCPVAQPPPAPFDNYFILYATSAGTPATGFSVAQPQTAFGWLNCPAADPTGTGKIRRNKKIITNRQGKSDGNKGNPTTRKENQALL